LAPNERRSAQRFDLKLPLTVRWQKETDSSEARTETRDVSSRGVYFFLADNMKKGSALEIVMTLPHEITLAGPVQVRCLGHVQRTEVREDHKVGVVAAIERYEFVRGND
jgi:c-di-GMP-binding flagellar brake protein YcgR